MRTAIILGIGFVLLGVCLAVGGFTGGVNRLRGAVLVFLVLWFVATAANMYIGVARAGYSFTEELPIFLLLFGVPAMVALIVRYKY